MALIKSYSESNYSGTLLGLSSTDNKSIGQNFSDSNTFDLTSVKFYLAKGSGVTGNVTARLYATSGGAPTGSALASSNSIDASTFNLLGGGGPNDNLGLIEFTFSTPYRCNGGTTYFIAIEKNNTGIIYCGLDGTSPTDPGVFYSTTDLSSWFDDTAQDLIYYIYGDIISLNNGNFFAFM